MTTNNDKSCVCWAKLVQCLFPLVYVIFAVVFLTYGYLLNDRVDEAADNTIPVMTLPHAEADIAAPQKGAITKGVDPKVLKTPTEELIAKGESIYGVTCASCHGAGLDGSGVASDPPPRNFLSADNWYYGTGFDHMYKTLQEGTPRGMASYANMPIMDRVALIHFIRSKADHFKPITDEEIANVDKAYGVSKDQVQPNRIPRDMAIMLLAQEAEAGNAAIATLASKSAGAKGAGADLFNRVTSDATMAFTALSRSSVWKKNPQFLAKWVSQSPAYYGFKDSVATLGQQDWNTLYNYLKAQKI